MKKAIYWLMGDRGGRITLNIWNWLWGLPSEPSPEEANSSGDRTEDIIANAEASLKAMQRSVNELARAVDVQTTTYHKARMLLAQKKHQVRDDEEQARRAQQQGDSQGAKLAMARAIQREQFLPDIERRVQQAEEALRTYHERLEREKMQLEAYRMDVQHLKDMADIGAALDTVAQTHNTLNLDSARSQLDRAKETLELQRLEDRALDELTAESSTSTDWEQTIRDDEIERRLQQFDRPSESS